MSTSVNTVQHCHCGQQAATQNATSQTEGSESFQNHFQLAIQERTTITQFNTYQLGGTGWSPLVNYTGPSLMQDFAAVPFSPLQQMFGSFNLNTALDSGSTFQTAMTSYSTTTYSYAQQGVGIGSFLGASSLSQGFPLGFGATYNLPFGSTVQVTTTTLQAVSDADSVNPNFPDGLALLMAQPNGDFTVTQSVSGTADSGYTRNVQVTTADGQTFNRDITLTRNEQGTVRTIHTTGPDGYETHRQDVTTFNPYGHVRTTTMTDAEGNTMTRSIAVSRTPWGLSRSQVDVVNDQQAYASYTLHTLYRPVTSLTLWQVAEPINRPSLLQTVQFAHNTTGRSQAYHAATANSSSNASANNNTPVTSSPAANDQAPVETPPPAPAAEAPAPTPAPAPPPAAAQPAPEPEPTPAPTPTPPQPVATPAPAPEPEPEPEPVVVAQPEPEPEPEPEPVAQPEPTPQTKIDKRNYNPPVRMSDIF